MRLVAIVTILLSLAGGASASTASGFWGTVTIGPLQPVCSPDKPCDGPAPHVTLSFLRNGVVVKRVVTGDTGDYRILLRYGPYSVRASKGMSIRPSRVWAHQGLVAKLNFAIDTGIR